MEHTRIGGIALPYEISGSGDPLLLMSTGPISDSFLPFLSQAALAQRFRLIRYNQRPLPKGAGAPVSFEQHAADAVALLNHLAISRAHIAGHSTGAVIALQLAADRPDLVRSLVLLEPPLLSVPSAEGFFESAKPVLARAESGDLEGAMRDFLCLVSGLGWDDCRAAIDNKIPRGVARALENAGNFFGSYLPALMAWSFDPEQVAGISRSVLSVHGSRTEPLFADGHRLLQSWFPDLEDCTIADVGHLLHLERPEPVARRIAEFLARC